MSSERDGSPLGQAVDATRCGVSSVVRAFVASSGFLVAGSGCQPADGPARIAVFGTVTSESGDPVSGMISFLPEAGTEGPAATASLIDGDYSFDTTNGPVAGRYRVLVVRQMPERKHKGGSESESGGGSAAAASNTSATAASEEWSFHAEVSPEEHEFDFQVAEQETAKGDG